MCLGIRDSWHRRRSVLTSILSSLAASSIRTHRRGAECLDPPPFVKSRGEPVRRPHGGSADLVSRRERMSSDRFRDRSGLLNNSETETVRRRDIGSSTTRSIDTRQHNYYIQLQQTHLRALQFRSREPSDRDNRERPRMVADGPDEHPLCQFGKGGVCWCEPCFVLTRMEQIWNANQHQMPSL